VTKLTRDASTIDVRVLSCPAVPKTRGRSGKRSGEVAESRTRKAGLLA